jgi:hypothetical protein
VREHCLAWEEFKMVSSLQSQQKQIGETSGSFANISPLCSLMIEDELVAMKAQDVLACLKTPTSAKALDWYAKIKEKFSGASQEASLEKFVSLIVAKKNERLTKYLNSFPSSGLLASMVFSSQPPLNQFEHYTALQAQLESCYKRYPIEAVLGIECPGDVQFEHVHTVKKCISETVVSNKKITLLGTSQKPISLSNKEINLLVVGILGAKCCYELTLKKVGLEDSQLELLTTILRSGKLESLDVSDNKLTDKAAQFLAAAVVEKECQVSTLVLQNNQLSDQGALLFVPYLSKKVAATLDLRGNKITQVAKAGLEKVAASSDTFSIVQI